MLGLKVQLKDAEKWKRYIVMNDIIDKEYFYSKDTANGLIYFPVKSRFDASTFKSVKSLKGAFLSKNSFEESFKEISFVEMEFQKSTTSKGTLRENLSKSLTKEELAFVKTAHDIIGSIAILEIPEDLEKREKVIAETLLKTNPQIKTVLKKADIHEGVFRTQKMTYLAGIDTKETVYKENNVQLKLDVEKVYFSIRLGNERKRIMQLVKPGEEILVMFSGCAPYPVVLSKNTKARHITGIEINPDGHKYGMENLRLNKIHNVLLINDDVHNAIPKIYQKIIGLKSAIHGTEMDLRLEKNPSIVEIHLFNDGLDDDKIPELERQIDIFKSKGLEVFVHMPFKVNGKNYALTDADAIALCKKLGELCKRKYVSAIIHLTHGVFITDENLLFERLSALEQYYDFFYFENLTTSFADKKDIVRISRKAKFKNLCIDLAHLYIKYEDNKKMLRVIKAFQKEFNTYFHVVDHDKKTHTCEVGRGLIDWEMILPLVNKGVIEVSSKDEANPIESIRSYDILKDYSRKYPKNYDRIIMPLPKTADEFLDDALSVSRKGTIIHFYDFLAIDKFDEAKEKIAKACKKKGLKHKILRVVKCGQHAPYIYRICVDVKIL